MTELPPPPPGGSSCVRCAARIPPGAVVCPNCGANSVPTAVATTGPLARLSARAIGVVVTLVVATLEPVELVTNANSSTPSIVAAALSALFVGSLVSLAIAKAGSLGRAFAVAVLLTFVGLIGVAGLLIAGALAICGAILSAHKPA